MAIHTRKTDSRARLTLPRDFAYCLVSIERHGDELGLRKVKRSPARRYAFRELMDKVTPENLHQESDFGRPVGKERL